VKDRDAVATERDRTRLLARGRECAGQEHEEDGPSACHGGESTACTAPARRSVTRTRTTAGGSGPPEPPPMGDNMAPDLQGRMLGRTPRAPGWRP
jgi:hypothetical protein